MPMNFARINEEPLIAGRSRACFNALGGSIAALCLLCLLMENALAAEPVAELSKLPTPVQETIRKETEDGTVTQITKVVENGETSYDVDALKAGKELSFSVSEAGALSEEITLANAPEPVQAVIRDQLGNGSLD